MRLDEHWYSTADSVFLLCFLVLPLPTSTLNVEPKWERMVWDTCVDNDIDETLYKKIKEE